MIGGQEKRREASVSIFSAPSQKMTLLLSFISQNLEELSKNVNYKNRDPGLFYTINANSNNHFPTHDIFSVLEARSPFLYSRHCDLPNVYDVAYSFKQRLLSLHTTNGSIRHEVCCGKCESKKSSKV